jgi:hypothetical protein
MLKARGIEGVRVLQGLLSLAGRSDDKSLENACEIALASGVFQLRPIRKLLARTSIKQRQLDFVDEHPIVRPLSDYRDWLAAALARDRDPRGQVGRAAHGGFTRHGWTNECTGMNALADSDAAASNEKSLGDVGRRGLRVIHPPRSGYPSSGCSSAEPDSVSPNESTVVHAGPLSSDASRSLPSKKNKEMLP